jgi:hypothetical protein
LMPSVSKVVGPSGAPRVDRRLRRTQQAIPHESVAAS